MVSTQIAGPSNGGGSLTATRATVRTSSPDPSGDALSSYSLLAPLVVPPAPATTNEPAGDFLSATVGPEVDLVDGTQIPNGGFTVKLKVADLSAASLQSTMTRTGSLSLLWVWRFTNGYQDAAASARWDPVGGFTFGYNDYATGSVTCGSSGEKCVNYPGDTPIQGTVDVATGTISLSVPRYLLRALGPVDGNGRPTEVAATVGSRFYDGTAFSLGNTTSPIQDVQSFLYPFDNTPAMDFLLGSGGGSGGGGGGGGTECKVNGGGSIPGTAGDAKFTLNAHANLKGHNAYRDDGANVDFRSTAIASVTCQDSTHSATIEGTGVNGRNDAVTFRIDVTDNGEPGKTDRLSITLSSGYTRTGTLTRGNIQIH
jgi:hypothetical protein